MPVDEADATGLVLYVARRAAVPARQEPIRRGVSWLKTNQRASGHWFTRLPEFE
jgi:hypothetical protein